MRRIHPSVVNLALAHVKRLLNLGLASFDQEIVRIDKGVVQPWETDHLFREIWAEVTRKTNTITGSPNMTRAYVLKDLLSAGAPIRDNVAECGVYQGATAITLLSYLQRYELLEPGKKFLLFDSFEGLSEPDPTVDGHAFRKGGFAADLESVQRRLRRFDSVGYWKGWIPERFQENSSRQFSFVHVDVDLYQPVRDCLEFFYPRLVDFRFAHF